MLLTMRDASGDASGESQIEERVKPCPVESAQATPPSPREQTSARASPLRSPNSSSWAPPSAWEGETSMGTPHTLPAPVMGDMIVGELAVHGWDLAVATGQRLELPAGQLAHLHDTVFAGVEQGREMGMYGPEVAVLADAPTLDRILGLTGRDPAWA